MQLRGRRTLDSVCLAGETIKGLLTLKNSLAVSLYIYVL